MIRTFDTLYIHPELKAHPRAMELVRRIPHRRVEELDSISELASQMKEDPAGSVPRGKYSLAIAPYPGRMVELCPATRGMSCCRYRVINLIAGCPIDCSYCILQGYLNRPVIFIYPELEKVFEEVDREIAACPEYPLRFGTGELSDSLALDHLTGFSHPLIEFFRRRPNAWFELKTKSVCVEGLLEVDDVPRNIVVSWSLNPQAVIDTEESHAPGLKARLQAAARVEKAGYRVGFHFDPIFYFHGWEEAYRKVIEEIYSHISPENTTWISLGLLRYSPWMRGFLAGRFGDHPLLAGELFPVVPDGKYRYPQPLRIDIYRRMYNWLREFDSNAYIYLCMESATVYRWALGREVEGDELAVERGFPHPPQD
ncbi:MAG: DNA photolyase [Gemmatimonadota bacterium]|nr:DNA photolyase [Gemmatimonadota bacterium]